MYGVICSAILQYSTVIVSCLMKAVFVWSCVFFSISFICLFNLLLCEALILVFCSCAFQRGLNRQAGQDYSLVSSFRNCNSCNLTCGHRPFFEFHQNKALYFDCHKKQTLTSNVKFGTNKVFIHSSRHCMGAVVRQCQTTLSSSHRSVTEIYSAEDDEDDDYNDTRI